MEPLLLINVAFLAPIQEDWSPCHPFPDLSKSGFTRFARPVADYIFVSSNKQKQTGYETVNQQQNT